MLPVVVIWVWLCAYLNCAGWVLSACHGLNRAGYAAAFAVGLGLLWVWKRGTAAPLSPPCPGRKLRRRFRHAFPLAFLVLAGLAFLGGALHPPANYDSLAYRTSRVLHWLAAGQWQWVHTDFPRLNTRTAGFEWVTAPLILFSGTDRLIFLLNVTCFLLLPGRIFAVLTRLGVQRQAAWHWMWLLPGAYGIILQAGSVVNDMFGMFVTLVAFEYALRAAQEKRPSLLWTAMVAAALMTAVKAFNIVLLLPWAIAAWPALSGLLRRPVMSAAVILFAAGASMIPTSVLDARYCGDWTGANIEHTPIGGGLESLRFGVNLVNLPLGNLAPPIFPWREKWDNLVQHMLPDHAKQVLHDNFEGSLGRFAIPDMQVEEIAGLGFGLSWLVLFLLLKKIRAGEFLTSRFWSAQTLVPLAAWAGVGVFMIRVGISGPARYLLPFYFLLIAPILAGPVAGGIFRRRTWRGAAFITFGLAALLLVITPPRPLWPALTSLRALDAEHSRKPILQRMWNVYSVYGARAEGFAPVLAACPPAVNPLGYMGFDAPETSLWRPFGSRRVVHICHDDAPAQIRAQGIKYALVSDAFLAQYNNLTRDEWLARNDAEVFQDFKLHLHAGQAPENWFLARFR